VRGFLVIGQDLAIEPHWHDAGSPAGIFCLEAVEQAGKVWFAVEGPHSEQPLGLIVIRRELAGGEGPAETLMGRIRKAFMSMAFSQKTSNGWAMTYFPMLILIATSQLRPSKRLIR